MALVSGYFDDGVDAEEAADSIHQADWAEGLEVVDRARLKDEFPHDVVLGGMSGQPAAAVHGESEPAEEVEDMLTVGNLQEYLEGHGVPEEEALFYARRLQEQGTLLIWEGDDDLAEQVLEVMKSHDAIVAAEQ